jgi:hypothetical protein
MAAGHEITRFVLHFMIAVVYRVIYYGTFNYDEAMTAAVIGYILESLYTRFMKPNIE